MSTARNLQWPPADTDVSSVTSHQVKRFHVVEGVRVPLQTVCFLIVLHVVGCWLSDLSHLLESCVNPRSVQSTICEFSIQCKVHGSSDAYFCKCPHSVHNMWHRGDLALVSTVRFSDYRSMYRTNSLVHGHTSIRLCTPWSLSHRLQQLQGGLCEHFDGSITVQCSDILQSMAIRLS